MQTNINKKPNITVLMPVYNGEKYLREAIESILNQSFRDFEFLIIDDGSTDKSEKIIKSYDDSRIKLVNNETNLGLIKSLNKGLDLAKGKYIARMDQDDISLSKRLEIQVDFMDKHPEIGISGTWAKTIGGNNKKYIKTYCNFEEIKVTTLFKSPMIHPSVIIRKDIFNKYNLKYDENHQHTEDYELWVRAIKHFPITNITKVLFLYRKHTENICKIYEDPQELCSKKIQSNQLKNNLSIISNDEDIIIHNSIYKPEEYTTTDFLNKVKIWFDKLIKQNEKTKFYKKTEFSQILAQRWLRACSVNSNYDFEIFEIFWKSDLRKKIQISDFIFLTKFFIKCLIFKKVNEH